MYCLFDARCVGLSSATRQPRRFLVRRLQLQWYRQVGGEPFPQRELLILVAFVVVLVTLLVQGLSYALAMGLVGGLLPAVRAARLPISSALRELEAGPRQCRRPWAIRRPTAIPR